VRGAVLAGSLLLAVLAAAGCGDERRPDPVATYIERANAVQARSATRFTAANQTFEQFAKGKLGGPQATRRLREAELDIETARQRLAALRPPPAARRLHALLLRTYEMNVLLAAETRQMAAYVPRAQLAFRLLDRISRRLSSALRRARTPAGQVRALKSYVKALDRMRGVLQRLDPPPVLEADRNTQLRRLASVQPVARQLARAIERRDADAVSRLIVRFREGGGTPPGRAGLRKGAIVAYQQRIARIDQAAADARTELARLARKSR
jgi:hypothetical protein